MYLPSSFALPLPGGSDGKESACNVGDLGLVPGLGRFPGGRHSNPASVFLPREFQGQGSLVGYRPWSCKELDTTERTHRHTHTPSLSQVSVFLFLGPRFILTSHKLDTEIAMNLVHAHACHSQRRHQTSRIS